MMFRRFFGVVAFVTPLVVLFLIGIVLPVSAENNSTNRYVWGDSAHGNTEACTNLAKPCADLEDAFDEFEAGDTVYIFPGSYVFRQQTLFDDLTLIGMKTYDPQALGVTCQLDDTCPILTHDFWAFNSNAFFEIESANVSFSGLIFDNANQGGIFSGIYIRDGEFSTGPSNLTFDNVLFRNFGLESVVNIKNGTALLRDCRFENAFSPLLNESRSVVQDCSFEHTGNIFNLHGGSMTISNGIFRNSSATEETGGGINNRGEMTIDDSTFLNNRANQGGAIHNTGILTLTDSFVISNTTLIDFDTAQYPELGGGIYNAGQLTMRNTVVTDNHTKKGGALYNSGSLAIEGGAFARNVANYEGGALLLEDDDDSSATTLGTTFLDNEARRGGAIYANHALTVDSSTFDTNTSIVDGGAIHIVPLEAHERFTCQGTVFTENRASGNGAGVYMGAGTASFDGCEWDGNQADDDGGGLYVTSDNSDLTLSNALFFDNSAYNGGGLFLNNSGDVAILSNIAFEENDAGWWGGGIFTKRPINYQGGSAESNTANTAGGGIYLDSPSSAIGVSSQINGVAFVLNSASDGGGLANEANLDLQIANSSFGFNDGERYGGAIYNTGDITFFYGWIGLNEVSNSFASQRGGGVWNGAGASFVLYGSTVEENSAKGGGGLWNEGDLIAANSTISGNSAENDGGGLYQADGTMTLNFVTVTENSADSQNTNSGNGGGLYIEDGTVTLGNSILAGNIDPFQGLFDWTHSPNCGTAFLIVDAVPITSDGYNIVGSAYCGITGTIIGNQVGASTTDQLDALLLPLDSNGGNTQTHLPQSNSPAVDNVTDTSRCTGLFVNGDQRNYSRPSGPGCDSGAVETDAVPTAIVLRHQDTVTSTISFLVVVTVALALPTVLISFRKQ